MFVATVFLFFSSGLGFIIYGLDAGEPPTFLTAHGRLSSHSILCSYLPHFFVRCHLHCAVFLRLEYPHDITVFSWLLNVKEVMLLPYDRAPKPQNKSRAVVLTQCDLE